jgi:hypothetical protein
MIVDDDDYYNSIINEAKLKIAVERSVIVFFDNYKLLKEFENSEKFKRNFNLH